MKAVFLNSGFWSWRNEVSYIVQMGAKFVQSSVHLLQSEMLTRAEKHRPHICSIINFNRFGNRCSATLVACSVLDYLFGFHR